MKKITTSKKILLVSYAVAIVLTAFVVYGAFAMLDMSNVLQIALVAWGEVTAANVWYYKKAARENVIKITMSLPKEIREQIDVNQMLNQ